MRYLHITFSKIVYLQIIVYHSIRLLSCFGASRNARRPYNGKRKKQSAKSLFKIKKIKKETLSASDVLFEGIRPVYVCTVQINYKFIISGHFSLVAFSQTLWPYLKRELYLCFWKRLRRMKVGSEVPIPVLSVIY